MSCEFTEQVSLLIDGELPSDVASRVERHVIGCTECREARIAFLNMRREISDYQITLDPRAQERALAEILAHREPPVPRPIAAPAWRERFAAFGFPRFATAMATVGALLVAAFVGIMMYRNSQQQAPIASVTSPEKPLSLSAEPAPKPSPVTTPEKKSGPPESPKAAPARQPRRPTMRPPVDRYTTPSFEVAGGRPPASAPIVSPADAETLTAQHVEQSSLLLRAFRNVRVEDNDELTYEKNRARQLLYQNILLRREATTNGNVQVASLLDSLEPILIDIANLPKRPAADEVGTIKQRMERKNLVPLLQVNSTQLARAYD